MIVITGAAGFIGSCLAGKLNREGFFDLVLVDDFSREDKKANWASKKFTEKVHRSDFNQWLDKHHRFVEFVFHFGARTDTTEEDDNIFRELNLEYSKKVWEQCARYGLPLIYASSAATYGDGSQGYDDRHDNIFRLQPLNAYARSKQAFDRWALQTAKKPYYWAGLKFFNVFGPNEYHKGRMASVVYHAFRQAGSNDKIRLFKSHNPDYADGSQKRDFIYVLDVVQACFWLMHNRKHSDIYNLGSGKARTFLDLASAVFSVLGKPMQIEFVNTPMDIRERYQYFTQAKMEKLSGIGCDCRFASLEAAIKDYIENYLSVQAIY